MKFPLFTMFPLNGFAEKQTIPFPLGKRKGPPPFPRVGFPRWISGSTSFFLFRLTRQSG